MSGQDPSAPGNPHGRQSPFRWDPSTAAAVIVLVALAFLLWVHVSFRVSTGVSAGRR